MGGGLYNGELFQVNARRSTPAEQHGGGANSYGRRCVQRRGRQRHLSFDTVTGTRHQAAPCTITAARPSGGSLNGTGRRRRLLRFLREARDRAAAGPRGRDARALPYSTAPGDDGPGPPRVRTPQVDSPDGTLTEEMRSSRAAHRCGTRPGAALGGFVETRRPRAPAHRRPPDRPRVIDRAAVTVVAPERATADVSCTPRPISSAPSAARCPNPPRAPRPCSSARPRPAGRPSRSAASRSLPRPPVSSQTAPVPALPLPDAGRKTLCPRGRPPPRRQWDPRLRTVSLMPPHLTIRSRYITLSDPHGLSIAPLCTHCGGEGRRTGFLDRRSA